MPDNERKRPPHISRKRWARLKLLARGHRVHGVLLEYISGAPSPKNLERQWRISQRNQARINRSYDENPGPYAGHGRYIHQSPEQLAHIAEQQATYLRQYEADAEARNRAFQEAIDAADRESIERTGHPLQ